ncbi:ABC transporter ATP-binding protein [Falsarthrobacter nasiphocae]|uniref:ABC-type quaternary amine transporter n=1 Tax=Falsarthrobacter nasiphocae TaxID=189863 RepID=A0AAE3YF59_9MICC|nr:ATP-binding cassette domain-containing protein [Falsarthrobacter nasiphocae]MDR6891572.1 osmoprotectant transport system ATP-binding protein [Falsarthrobacter nasiphocae]
MNSAAPKIRFENVSVSYGGAEPAVRNVSLDIPEGSFTVFVGPSGCGKTTSLRLINRMVLPSEGRVLLNGRDVKEGPAHELRRGIGYVMQSAGLLPHRTVLRNIMTVPALEGRADKNRAMELMELVGLDAGLAKRYPAELSGGQQQRVGVARALAADPEVVLMDEPFSAIDPVVRADLQREVLRLQRELKKTFVMVTHDIDEAVLLGTRIAVFGPGGRLAQTATPYELLTQPADDFVAGFVGRDRGFRALGYVGAERLDTLPLAADPEWVLQVDDDGRPRGWTGSDGVTHAGGTLYVQGDSLRQALDAALSSPSGLGVVVDAQGRAVSLVAPSAVLAAMDAK